MTEQKTFVLSEKLAETNWPAEGLESVHACPVCGDKQRRLLYASLRDRVFFCAPGEWSLHECLKCHSAYLNPRPTPATIHLAYRNYFTHHGEPRPSKEALRGLRRVRRALANGYLNWRFGSAFEPASALGVLVAFLLPSKRAMMDRAFRHLPAGPSRRRLLDVGCGNGSFLEIARSAGWNAIGIDPDPEAVKTARQLGVEVYQGGLEVMDGERDRFDAITMSHVIEHLHDLRATLARVNCLLRPGGMLWLETPNIESFSHDRFGRNALHLDPPRHLVIFSWPSLMDLLRETGFSIIQPRTCYTAYPSVAAMSRRIEVGVDPFPDLHVSNRDEVVGKIAALISFVWRRKSEFITLTAYKAMLEISK